MPSKPLDYQATHTDQTVPKVQSSHVGSRLQGADMADRTRLPSDNYGRLQYIPHPDYDQSSREFSNEILDLARDTADGWPHHPQEA